MHERDGGTFVRTINECIPAVYLQQGPRNRMDQVETVRTVVGEPMPQLEPVVWKSQLVVEGPKVKTSKRSDSWKTGESLLGKDVRVA